MTKRKSLFILLVLLFGMLLFAAPASPIPSRSGYVVIVHPTNPVRAISRAFLRDAFLKNTTRWGDGAAIRPVDLARSFPVYDEFSREILNKTPEQLRDYWSQFIYTGKGVPPPELRSETAMIVYVLRNPGAVGYLPAGANPRGAAVVTVR